MPNHERIGWVAITLAMYGDAPPEDVMKICHHRNLMIAQGKVGTMDMTKAISSIMLAAKREGVVSAGYREDHALYHAVLEAISGITRGDLALGDIFRTAGLRFSIVRGHRSPDAEEDGEWIAVAIYGTMGAPIKGYEHEVVGLGMNHI